MNTQSVNKRKWLLGLACMPLLSFSQEAEAAAPSVFSNALFNTLLGVIIFLVIVVIALNQVLKNLAQSDYLVRKREEENKSGNAVNKTVALVAFTLLALHASAADETVTPEVKSWLIGGLDMFTFYFMMSIIFLEIVVIGLLLNTLQGLLRPRQQKAVVVQGKKKEKNIIEILNASVEVEKESEIMLDHDYDGIRELDNDLPPWWRYGFYLTILVAVVYLIHYHITFTGDLQIAEYNKEVAKGKEEVEAYMKLSAANVDETTVKMLEGSDVEAGKGLFVSTCAACHGKTGEGGVGPNLTDAYWLHGGSLSDIFKTIKYGWPDKGMKSWKEDLSPVQIAQVSSFIKTLVGTNPPNGKAPQGDLFKEGGAVSDSLVATVDSLKINKPDSASVTKGTH